MREPASSRNGAVRGFPGLGYDGGVQDEYVEAVELLTEGLDELMHRLLAAQVERQERELRKSAHTIRYSC